MKTEYQKCKVTIELEDGVKAEFVAVLHVRERRVPFDPQPSHHYNHDGKWNGMKLPEPPQWNIEGTTLGAMVMTTK